MHKEIYLAGGCFWGTQHFLKEVEGVLSTQVGYANGRGENPTYEEVYTDLTGFAETVKVCFEAERLRLEELLELYFMTIDPTSLNQQGGDRGTRYRTGIYFTDPADKVVIDALCQQMAVRYDAPLVVEVEPLSNFYPAEEYHQDYLERNPAGYCHIPLALMQWVRNRKK